MITPAFALLIVFPFVCGLCFNYPSSLHHPTDITQLLPHNLFLCEKMNTFGSDEKTTAEAVALSLRLAYGVKGCDKFLARVNDQRHNLVG